MTKEQLIEQVEIAYKIYELFKPIPYYERYVINGMVEQLTRADQQKETANCLTSDVVSGRDCPVHDYPVPKDSCSN